MTRQQLYTPAILALTLTMAAAPALAQSGERERRPRERAQRSADAGSRESNAERGGREYAVRRGEARPETPRETNAGAYNGRGSENRGGESRGSENRGGANRGTDSRGDRGRQDDDWRVNGRATSGRNDEWRGNDRRDEGWRGDRGYSGRDDWRYHDRRYDDWRRSNRDWGWGDRYDRSWRSRVRFALGISIFAGRPVSFHFDYYRWRPSFAYHYPVRPGVPYGGMSFLLYPDWAEVYIDGSFAGIAREFGGQPVPVAAGYHRIEIYAPGYEPVAFDVNIYPGQVIPYRGNLYRAY